MGTSCYNVHNTTIDLSSNLTAALEESSSVPVIKKPPTRADTESPLAYQMHEFHTHPSAGRAGKVVTKSKMMVQTLATEEAKHEYGKMKTCAAFRKISTRQTPEDLRAMTRSMEEGKKRTRSTKSLKGISCNLSFSFMPVPAQFRCENKKQLEERYDVLEVIGKGGFGEVRKIQDKFTKVIRALKTMQKSKCQAAKEFSEEIQILQRLDHPNVVRFFEYYQDAANYYLVTEYCEGGDLLSKLRVCRRLSEDTAAGILKQILSAVEYCHKNNIIHRDLKPENVVFEGEGIDSTLKVIDFGRSKIVRWQEKITEKAGSVTAPVLTFHQLLYVAPEIVMQKEYNDKCDLWSCGVILYLMITGYPPFYGETKEQIVLLIKEGKVEYTEPVWATVSTDCKTLLQRMLTSDPSKRISASDALAHPFITSCTGAYAVSGSDLRMSLLNLRNFRTQTLFQKAVLTYIASQQLLQQEEAKFRRIFDTFDLNKDGQLTLEELIEGYTSLYGDAKKAKKQAEQIMKNIDLNHNGTIEYNEFLVANLQLSTALKEENLKKAFEFYDTDNNGHITVEELGKIFGTMCDEKTLRTLIEEVDTNHDSQISYEEFKQMMDLYKHKAMMHDLENMWVTQ